MNEYCTVEKYCALDKYCALEKYCAVPGNCGVAALARIRGRKRNRRLAITAHPMVDLTRTDKWEEASLVRLPEGPLPSKCKYNVH